MKHIRGEVTIAAPVEEVFDLVADERTEPRYNPRIARAEKISDGPVGRGSRFVVEPRRAGARGRMLVEVLEFDRPRRLHHAIHASYLEVDGTLTFEDTGGATRLRWDWEIDLVGGMRIMSPVLALVGSRWERRNWIGLKQYVEAGGR